MFMSVTSKYNRICSSASKVPTSKHVSNEHAVCHARCRSRTLVVPSMIPRDPEVAAVVKVRGTAS
jgi:hypothetical protein